MALTEEELAAAFNADVGLGAAVLSGQLSAEQRDMYLWYATRICYTNRDRLALPASCELVLAIRAELFELMLYHGKFPKDGFTKNYLAALNGQSYWLSRLRAENPTEFHDANQEFMLQSIPDHLLEAFRAGTLTCEELARAFPRMFLPVIAGY